MPAIFAFSHLGTLDAAAWLGLGTLLIPVGWLIVRRAEGHGHGEPLAGASPREPLFAVALAGLILIAAGIWLPIVTDGPDLWNASYSGHALGIVALLVVMANAATLLLPLVSGVRVSANRALMVACASLGFTAAGWLDAFNHLGRLGTGGWVEAVGGLLLLAGVLAMRLVGARAPRAVAVTP